MLLVRFSIANEHGDTDFSLIEPFYDVFSVPNTAAYRSRRARVEKVAGGTCNIISDGKKRLECGYVCLRDEAAYAYKLEPIRNILRPAHLFPDPIHPLCFY